MTFGQRVALVRKQRGLKQSELGELIEVSGDIVSKYERDLITPSIATAANFAKALNISLDYLAMGQADLDETSFDAVSFKMRQLEKLSDEDKAHIMAVIEAFLTKAKLKALMG